MGRARKSKRQLIRDERKKKKIQQRLTNEAAKRGAERSLLLSTDDHEADFDLAMQEAPRERLTFEREFFGMLADEEQEYFRHADELLELNDFPSPDDRAIFLQSVYKEAEGKELKLASSQSCSRLMERLILLSNTRQKKHLFEAFAGHFTSLITHRFASHCCERLFLQSAPVVTQELYGGLQEDPNAALESQEKPQPSMENLFLQMLDELEHYLSFFVSDRYGSHTLRLILVILSGRPLDSISTKSLLQSQRKEHITVPGMPGENADLNSGVRDVPTSFTLATRKIIADSTAKIDATALRVLAKHPTGNPTLQLLLELDISLTTKSKELKSVDGGDHKTLLSRLVPDAPASFSNADSEASEFVNAMLYDPIGSRLLETLIMHCPGKIFKGLQANIFGPRIHSILRNETASYPAIRVLNRLSKEDLVDAVQKSLPQVPQFLERGRLNVLKTLFERCTAREATVELEALLKALIAAVGGDPKHLVPKLCIVREDEDDDEDEKQEEFQHDNKDQSALVSHGSQLVRTMLEIPGSPAAAIQASLASLSREDMLSLTNFSRNSAAILTTAFATPSQTHSLHKSLVAKLIPNVMKLVESRYGQSVLNAVISVPSRGDGISVPFFQKELIISKLADHEKELRESWMGRSVWRAWKGDLWAHRRSDWIRWAKEADPVEQRQAAMPKAKQLDRWHGNRRRMDDVKTANGEGKSVVAV